MENLSIKSLLCTICMAMLLSTTLFAQEKEKEKGDFYLVNIEYVSPENRAEYVKWGEEFKALAAKTNFRNFYVTSDMEAFYYVWNVGQEKDAVAAFYQEWNEWTKANPGADEMYKKYSHTMSHMKTELWRKDVVNSYQPKGYQSDGANTYTRNFTGYLKPGNGKAVNELLKEYVDEWTARGISQPYNIYWNMMGTEQPCMMVVSSYKDREAWIAERKEVMEKIGKEKLEAWDMRWNKLLRKMETREMYPRMDLSHLKSPVATATSDE